jgi:hypothetical protein
LNAIAAAAFSAQSAGTAVSRFLAINATAAASPMSTGSLVIGRSYHIGINDVDGGPHITHGNVLVALYKRNSDGTVAAGPGPIASTDSWGYPQLVTEEAGTTMKAGMVVCEFREDLFNGSQSQTGKTLANGDTLTIGMRGHRSSINKAGVSSTAAHGEATSLNEMINVYSFALKPEEHQPSGTCNFSRIDNAKLMFDTAPASTVDIYAVNYNVLRIMSGMGGLAYSN